MPTKVTYSAPSAIATYLTTELNSLADAGNKLGAKIDNEADGENEMFLDVELYVSTQGSARDAGAYIELYLLSSVDGTNFGYGSDSLDPPASSLLDVFLLDAATTARYLTLANLQLPPLDFKLLLINNTGQAFAATANTLKYRIHSLEQQ